MVREHLREGRGLSDVLEAGCKCLDDDVFAVAAGAILTRCALEGLPQDC